MKHLNRADVIDAAEGSPSPASRAHLQACERCRGEVVSAAAMLEETRAVDVPEPSPLFWEHFSRRVRERIDAAPERSAPGGQSWGPRIWAPAGALVAILAVGIGISTFRAHNVSNAPGAAGRPGATDLSPVFAADDPNWTMVADVADGLEWEDAETAGLAVRPGAAERAAMDLSDEQQQELARLLLDEIGRLKS